MRAVSHIAESLTACNKLGDKEIAARGITQLAAIAVERGDLPLAAQFCGSVAALRDAIGAPVAQSERASHKALVGSIRAGLTGSLFSAAWEAGYASSLADSVTAAAAMVTTEDSSPNAKSPARNVLTPREREVLEHLARGRSDKEIAAELYIGQRTVSSHVAAILAKLRVSSRAAAVAITLRESSD
jgi:DNA-binding NarL/FixJ family response regulator